MQLFHGQVFTQVNDLSSPSASEQFYRFACPYVTTVVRDLSVSMTMTDAHACVMETMCIPHCRMGLSLVFASYLKPLLFPASTWGVTITMKVSILQFTWMKAGMMIMFSILQQSVGRNKPMVQCSFNSLKTKFADLVQTLMSSVFCSWIIFMTHFKLIIFSYF